MRGVSNWVTATLWLILVGLVVWFMIEIRPQKNLRDNPSQNIAAFKATNDLASKYAANIAWISRWCGPDSWLREPYTVDLENEFVNGGPTLFIAAPWDVRKVSNGGYEIRMANILTGSGIDVHLVLLADGHQINGILNERSALRGFKMAAVVARIDRVRKPDFSIIASRTGDAEAHVELSPSSAFIADGELVDMVDVGVFTYEDFLRCGQR